MNKLRISILSIFLISVAVSCKEDFNQEEEIKPIQTFEFPSAARMKADLEPRVPNLKGLKYNLPSNISEETILLNSEKFKEKFHKLLDAKNKDAKEKFSKYSFDLQLLEKMVKKAKSKYPDYESITDGKKELLNKYFPDLTGEQFFERKKDVESFFNQLIINELIEETADAMTNGKAIKNGKVSSNLYSVNFDEWWFYITHSDYGSCAAEARDKAYYYANMMFPGNQGDTRADAFRHSFWMNMLAKYGGAGESEVSTAANRALSAGYFHEYGKENWYEEVYPPVTASREMDMHNNRYGCSFFQTIAWTYVAWGGFWGLFSDTDVGAPEDTWIASALAWRAWWQSDQVAEDVNAVWGVPANRLVYFQP